MDNIIEKINFCVYSNEKYSKPRKSILNLAKRSLIFNSIFEYDREWLEKTKFYSDNIGILGDTNGKGDGWCLWKPYVILESLKKIENGEILIYMDSTDTFSSGFKEFIIEHFNSNEFLLSQMGDNKNSVYTKRDTFHYMGCDSIEYWETPQLEAGIIGVRKNENTIRFMEEYLKYCQDERIIKDSPNICGKDNLGNYIGHRYDQSVLTNLKVKYSIKPCTDIRYYVECNIWEALHYWNNIGEFNRKINLIESRFEERPENNMDIKFWRINYLEHLIK
jgi:hypothetical protein